jgi:dGTP triphosphohydrolase
MKKKGEDVANKKHHVQSLLSQLMALRRELREILHAYEARLEIALAEIANDIAVLKVAKSLPRERVRQIDNFVVLLRTRKLKPQKGRRKDLRKIEKFINDLHATLRPNLPR